MTGMEMKESSMKTSSKTEELVITRVFDAPRELVWRAWSDPQWITKWWGPQYFTSPACKADFRVGGKYLFCMRSPDGQDFWSTGEYREIVPLERIVLTDNFADADGNVIPATQFGFPADFPEDMVMTVTFEALSGNRTKLTISSYSALEGEMRENARLGWETSLDKMAEVLKPKTHMTIEPGKQDLTITRIFDVPPEQVFKVYTDPALIPRWWGPRRYWTRVDRLEVRPGGQWRFVNGDDQGIEYGFHGVYHDIETGKRIVQTFEFDGAPGHVSLESAVFEALEGGRTLLTNHAVYQSVEARDAMIGEGMEEGMNDTFDRLDEILRAQ